VRVSRLITDAGKRQSYKPRSLSHGTYVFVLEGEMRCGETLLGRRDSMGIWGVDRLDFEITADATDLLIVETMMMDDEVIKQWETEHAGH
jgi:hypothetical protein